MGNPKPLIESENFTYEILIESPTLGIPFDGFSLTNAMTERGYTFEPKTDQDIAIAKKQNSTITINTTSTIIAIQDSNVEKISSIVREMLDMLENECEFDLDKYPVIHQISSIMIVKTGFNPLESMTKSFFKNLKSKIDSIYKDNFRVSGVHLSEGDRYGAKFHELRIDPRYSRDSTTYNITYSHRDIEMDKILDSMGDSRDRILQTLKLIDES